MARMKRSAGAQEIALRLARSAGRAEACAGGDQARRRSSSTPHMLKHHHPSHLTCVSVCSVAWWCRHWRHAGRCRVGGCKRMGEPSEKAGHHTDSILRELQQQRRWPKRPSPRPAHACTHRPRTRAALTWHAVGHQHWVGQPGGPGQPREAWLVAGHPAACAPLLLCVLELLYKAGGAVQRHRRWLISAATQWCGCVVVLVSSGSARRFCLRSARGRCSCCAARGAVKCGREAESRRGKQHASYFAPRRRASATACAAPAPKTVRRVTFLSEKRPQVFTWWCDVDAKHAHNAGRGCDVRSIFDVKGVGERTRQHERQREHGKLRGSGVAGRLIVVFIGVGGVSGVLLYVGCGGVWCLIIYGCVERLMET